LLVGIDTLVIDDRRDKRRPAHCGFLGNGILIVENLTNLGMIRDRAVEAYFIPLKIRGAVSVPIRAFARET
jgi:kynurenine formamidase